MRKNKKEIRIISQRRSGHHAILFWIIAQIKGPVCYINNFTRIRIKKNINLRGIKEGYGQEGYRYGEYWHFFNMDEFSIVKEDLFSIKDKELFILNVEEENLKGLIIKIENSKFYPKNKSEEIFNTIVLRDPYNQFASRLKWETVRTHLKGTQLTKKGIKQWISHAKEYLGITSYLDNKILINYNEWFSNVDYRKKISRQLGLNFKNNISTVPKFGGGSSFDLKKFNGKGSEMKVLERWKYYRNDSRFLKLLKNKELTELSTQIFGKIIN